MIFDVKNSNDKGFDLRNMILFRCIRADYKKTGRKEKRHYLVELDYPIRRLQISRYFLADQKEYKEIQIPRKQKLTGGLRNFYLYIGRMISIVKRNISEGTEPFYILTVDEVAKIMELNIERNDKRKEKVKAYLDIIINVLSENAFSYVFFKGEQQR